MTEAWIYAADSGEAAESARLLEELGFSARRVSVNGSLRPSAEDGGSARRPTLMLVLAGGEGPAAGDLCHRLEQDVELSEIPRVVALDTDDLQAGVGVAEGHELIVRPYSCVELGIRIARARQQISGVDSDVLRVGELELNLANYQVSIDGRPINFTYMEYELLKFFVTHPGRVFTREALLSRVWGYDYYGGERTVDVHIRRLRAKLGQDYGGRIQTVRSVGYRFDA
ncbi:MAG: winged helix-turn-helix domain-containing protein [Solirubrobacteraceae bacterium]